MKDGICPKCQCDKVIPRARVIDRTHNGTQELTVEVVENPDALFFKGSVRDTLHAYICGGCGYSELYADDPRGLWLAYQRSQELKN